MVDRRGLMAPGGALTAVHGWACARAAVLASAAVWPDAAPEPVPRGRAAAAAPMGTAGLLGDIAHG
jgi:hypothetical protein